MLTYHVASGAVYSKDLKDGMMIPTLESETLAVSSRMVVSVISLSFSAATSFLIFCCFYGFVCLFYFL